MEERAQGAIEYLLMLAAALTVVGSVAALVFGTSEQLGSSVEEQISEVEENLIRRLTGA